MCVLGTKQRSKNNYIMTRSSKKQLYFDKKLQAKAEKANKESETINQQTWARKSVITPEMVGHIFRIHNGKEFIKLEIVPEHIGHRLGEFSPPRRVGKHGKAGTH